VWELGIFSDENLPMLVVSHHHNQYSSLTNGENEYRQKADDARGRQMAHHHYSSLYVEQTESSTVFEEVWQGCRFISNNLILGMHVQLSCIISSLDVFHPNVSTTTSTDRAKRVSMTTSTDRKAISQKVLV